MHIYCPCNFDSSYSRDEFSDPNFNEALSLIMHEWAVKKVKELKIKGRHPRIFFTHINPKQRDPMFKVGDTICGEPHRICVKTGSRKWDLSFNFKEAMREAEKRVEEGFFLPSDLKVRRQLIRIRISFDPSFQAEGLAALENMRTHGRLYYDVHA